MGLIAYPKIILLTDGYIWTILEQFGISLKTFETIPRNVPQKIPRFPECVLFSLNTFPKDPRTHGGVYFDHLEQFGISFRTIK